MSIIVSGRTTADYGNPSRLQTLAGASLVFYSAKDQGNVARVRWGYYPVGDEVAGRPLGSAVVQPDGTFSAKLADHDGPVVVVIEVERFTYAPATGKKARGVLGMTMLPRQLVADLSVAQISIDLGHAAYCSLLKDLDLWLAAGRVLAGSPAMGVSGVQVTAFDRDITQDDELGTATTDPSGSFEVFFAGETFRRLPGVFLGLRSLELVAGPDLFFRVRTGTVSLLDEPPSTGRTTGRENSRNCSYNELTVPLPASGPTPGVESGPTLWQKIGDYRIDTGSGGDLDPDGLTTVGKKAFFSVIKLRGAVFRRFINGEPIRYRFLVREWSDPKSITAGPGMPPAVPAGSVDADPDVPPGWQALIVGVSGEYGQIVSYSFTPPTFTFNSVGLPATPNARGWITVDQRPLGPNDAYTPSGELCRFDTRVLVPPGDMRHRKFSVVFQVQTPSVAYQQPAQPIHINNDGVRLSFTLNGLGAGCDPFTRSSTGTVDINATIEVEHPYLHDYATYVRRHDGVNQQSLSANATFNPTTPYWLDPPGITAAATLAGYAVEPCSYQAGVTAQARLTTGEIDMPRNGPASKSFCVR